MSRIKLVAFDLDNTLLDKDKKISSENLEALKYAKSKGIYIVPTTGRLFDNIPQELKDLCRYFILVNGAFIYDYQTDTNSDFALIPKDLALEILSYGDTLPCIYDSYIEYHGYMSASQYEMLFDYMPDHNYAVTMKAKRSPVPDLKGYILEGSRDVQKIQYYFQDLEERERQIAALGEKFPGLLYISTSLQSNIEINIADAIKGNAIRRLCAKLGLSTDEVAGFGDGTNDLSLIKEAGTGVCMSNGAAECLACADIITEYDCNHSGFARELLKLI